MPRWFLALGLGISLLPGCGRGEPVSLVRGTVYLDDKPFKGSDTSWVIFAPDKSKGNTSPHEPRSLIGGDGRYTLKTAEREGAAPGWYKVRVEAAEPIDMKKPYEVKFLVPKKYIDLETSGLRVEVAVNPAAGAYDLKLKK